MVREESCKYYLYTERGGKCSVQYGIIGFAWCTGREQCKAYERATLKLKEHKTEVPLIASKDDAMQAIIFLLSEWEIQPQEVLEEYNRLVH